MTKLYFLIKAEEKGAGEMAQCIRAPVALAEDSGSVPRTHVLPYNCL